MALVGRWTLCRRCGEPDKRGNTRNRRARKRWMLATFGDGIKCPCLWCGAVLDYSTVQADRLIVGGPYARWNIVASCGPCNRSRTRAPIPEGCEYG